MLHIDSATSLLKDVMMISEEKMRSSDQGSAFPGNPRCTIDSSGTTGGPGIGGVLSGMPGS
jgi:hypothetical protein